MKRFSSVFVIFALTTLATTFVCCSSEKEDEQMIEETIKTFYHRLSNKKYKDISELVSPNMLKEVPFFKSLAKESVGYSSIKVESINIKGEKATVVVSTMDEFNNHVNFTWNMIKIKNLWKVDNYGYIAGGNTYNNVTDSTKAVKNTADTLQKIKTLSPSTNIQEQEF